MFGGLDGAQGRNRTTDTRIFSPLLYRLSYLGAGVHCDVLCRDAGDSFGRADHCGASVARSSLVSKVGDIVRLGFAAVREPRIK